MIRWTDLIGFAGFASVLLGTQWLFPVSSVDPINWYRELSGLALCLAGFASVVGWILLRFWQAGKSHPK